MAKKRSRPKKLERQILDVMEGSCWRIKDLLTSLPKNSIGFDSEATFLAIEKSSYSPKKQIIFWQICMIILFKNAKNEGLAQSERENL